MGKYEDTFESETIGAAPANWARFFSVADFDLLIGEPGGSPADKSLHLSVNNDLGRRFTEFTDPPGSADSKNVNIMARVQTDTELYNVGVFGRGVSLGWHSCSFRPGSSNLTLENQDGFTLDSNDYAIGFTPTTGTWYWIRLDITDSRIRAKIWADGDAEPILWQVDRTSSLRDGTTGVNAVGVVTNPIASPGSPNNTNVHFGQFGVGTSGGAGDPTSNEKGTRLSSSSLRALTQFSSDMQIKQANIQTVDALDAEMRVDQVAVLALWGGIAEGIRVDQTAVLVLAHGVPCKTHRTQVWAITRTDGTVYRFTTLDVSVTYLYNTYIPCGGLASSAIETNVGLSESGNVEINAILNSSHIKDQEVLAGLFDGATVEAWDIPWQTDAGELPYRIFFGEIGKIEKGTVGFSAEVVTQASKAQQRNLLQTYTPGCRHQLGDSVCRVDTGALQVSGTVTNITLPTDPGQARKRAFNDTSRGEADGYFDHGILTWTSGDNAGSSYEVETYSSVTGFTLWGTTAYRIQVGDGYNVIPGCDKTSDTCKTKFNNFSNYGGFPHIPGKDKILGIRVKKNEVR